MGLEAEQSYSEVFFWCFFRIFQVETNFLREHFERKFSSSSKHQLLGDIRLCFQGVYLDVLLEVSIND